MRCFSIPDIALADDRNQAPNPKNCPDGYYPWDTSCYKLSTHAGWAPMDSTAAQDKCHSDSSGHPGYSGLVTVWNEHESQFVLSYFSEITQHAWMGLTYKYDLETGSLEYTWNDNMYLIYSYWGQSQPSKPETETGCVEFLETGAWTMSKSCTTALPFICKIEMAYDPNTDQDLGEAKCDPGWSLVSSDKGEEDNR